jgi:hypothetical protein
MPYQFPIEHNSFKYALIFEAKKYFLNLILKFKFPFYFPIYNFMLMRYILHLKFLYWSP